MGNTSNRVEENFPSQLHRGRFQLSCFTPMAYRKDERPVIRLFTEGHRPFDYTFSRFIRVLDPLISIKSPLLKSPFWVRDCRLSGTTSYKMSEAGSDDK